ncbi:DUF2336 domain-containing protein [Pseudokordiimonas caeni]|uniref:DUF2336 domain-containing protein n=1 Tax=Pseudokordiimonas caeni TaxID=2997908 RepID=UPI0028117117|nr:DUF2336 domain-containing protein [Pseudokordiimonas caeni]
MLIDSVKLEKMMLAKRVAKFLNGSQSDDDRIAVEDVARLLARDLSTQVREVLAFELRHCDVLPSDLAEKIARDVEDVASPFLSSTHAFNDETLAALIPSLAEHARVTIARRPDLGGLAVKALAEHSEAPGVTTLVRNDSVGLTQEACDAVVGRFGGDRRLMDQLSARADLPLVVVEQIIDKVSDHCRDTLMQHYAVDGTLAEKIAGGSRIEALWQQIANAAPQQVHALVNDMRKQKRLTHLLVAEMAERGSAAFLESSFALEAGLPIIQVREALNLKKAQDFVDLMKRIGVSKAMAPRFLNIARKLYVEGAHGTNDNAAPSSGLAGEG